MTGDIKDIKLTSTIELCIINDIEIENEAIEVYEAQRCNECNSRFSSDDDKHVIAFSKRYKHSSATLVPLCRNCFKEITTSDIYHTFYQTPCHGFTDATHGNAVLVFQKSNNKKESQKEEKILSKYLIAEDEKFIREEPLKAARSYRILLVIKEFENKETNRKLEKYKMALFLALSLIFMIVMFPYFSSLLSEVF